MFRATVNSAISAITTHAALLLYISNGSFLPQTLSEKSTYIRENPAIPVISRGFCLSDSSMSPSKSANTERVRPHPGHIMCSKVYDGHGGKYCTYCAQNFAAKYPAKITQKGSSVYNIFSFLE